jgi:hypothetical protein
VRLRFLLLALALARAGEDEHDADPNSTDEPVCSAGEEFSADVDVSS